jgi:elongation factor Ts
MANVTAQMVKELRDKTGAGMMDCKAALGETAGDVEAAVDWLRKKGLAKAAKKAGRIAAEGLIGVALAAGKGVVVEVNSETDFVARNELFQGLVKMIAQVALSVGTDVEAIKAAKVGAITIADAIADTIAKIGENMTLRRAAAISVGKGVLASYVHSSVADGLGKIGVIVTLESGGKADELTEFGRKVAMHVAASNPQALDAAGLDPVVVQREKDVLAEKFKAQGKPANVIDKIVESGLKTFYKEVCLLDQPLSTIPISPWRRRPRRRSAPSAHRSRLPALCALLSARGSTGPDRISPARSPRLRGSNRHSIKHPDRIRR